MCVCLGRGQDCRNYLSSFYLILASILLLQALALHARTVHTYTYDLPIQDNILEHPVDPVDPAKSILHSTHFNILFFFYLNLKLFISSLQYKTILTSSKISQSQPGTVDTSYLKQKLLEMAHLIG